jgi:L-asparaginase II
VAVAEPGIVEAVRAGVAESRHRLHAVICRADGTLVASAGDPSLATTMRSAAKPFQALPSVAAGVLERFGLDDRHLAVACGSHDGAQEHSAVVADLCGRSGIPLSELRPRGVHEPLGHAAARALARAGQVPSVLEHNCSGNHALMLAHAHADGLDPAGYLDPEGPLQLEAGALMTQIAGEEVVQGVDRCGMGSYALPLTAMATAYARLASGLGDGLRDAGRRVVQAMRSHVELVAGPGEADAAAMRFDGVVAKRGAGGILCVASAETGLGGALKVEDGFGPATVMAAGPFVTAVAGLPTTPPEPRLLRDGDGTPVGEWNVALVLA